MFLYVKQTKTKTISKLHTSHVNGSFLSFFSFFPLLKVFGISPCHVELLRILISARLARPDDPVARLNDEVGQGRAGGYQEFHGVNLSLISQSKFAKLYLLIFVYLPLFRIIPHRA